MKKSVKGLGSARGEAVERIGEGIREHRLPEHQLMGE